MIKFNLKTLFFIMVIVACACTCYHAYSTCTDTGICYRWVLSQNKNEKIQLLLYHLGDTPHSVIIEYPDLLGEPVQYAYYNNKLYKCNDDWLMFVGIMRTDEVSLPDFKVDMRETPFIMFKMKAPQSRPTNPYTIIKDIE